MNVHLAASHLFLSNIYNHHRKNRPTLHKFVIYKIERYFFLEKQIIDFKYRWINVTALNLRESGEITSLPIIQVVSKTLLFYSLREPIIS